MSDEELEVDVVSEAEDDVRTTSTSPADLALRKDTDQLKNLCETLNKRRRDGSADPDGSDGKSPVCTPNPIYTSFSISSILNRADSKTSEGNPHNAVLDAASSFLAHHPDPAMLSR